MIDLSWNTRGRIALADYRKARWRHILFCLIPFACYAAGVAVAAGTVAALPGNTVTIGAGIWLLGTVLLFYYRYRFLQVMVKRLHDRGMSGKLLVLSPIFMVLMLGGLVGVIAVGAGSPTGNTVLDHWINGGDTSVVIWAVLIPFIIFNFFLRFQMNRSGTPGANRFGPPPGVNQAQVF